jgi:hypothetical protein
MREKTVIDRAAITPKEKNCSRFARRHHSRQRARFFSSSGKR